MKARAQDLWRFQMARQRRWPLRGSAGIALSMALVGAGLFALKSSAQRPDPSAIADQDALPPQRAVDQWKPAIATVFWVGEEASPDNGFIHNKASAWDVNWQKSFGGIDDPKDRCGYRPCAFKPLENAFYVALPYNDITDAGNRKRDTSFIPWDVRHSKVSVLKNRWIAVRAEGRTCYGQWQDVGPFESDDVGYVFGSEVTPKNKIGVAAGIDISPAMRDCLRVGDLSHLQWRHTEASDVPPGPWKEVVTTRPGP